jgi:acyl-CoA synthetase (AMP-forming)/AMP-acid ligase II
MASEVHRLSFGVFTRMLNVPRICAGVLRDVTVLGTPPYHAISPKARVAAYKYPRLVWLVDALPTGPTGKILKREIHPPTELLTPSR